MPSKLQKAIGAVKDQTSISLAKVAHNNSSNLEVAVLKATTHDDVPIDERYVSEILQFVSSDKTYAASCARAIGKRIGRTRNWIVALKSLMLVLRIFQDGDPYFPREVLHAMKRGAKILNLSSFRNDSNSSPWDFTAFIRTFALYLDERLDCFLTGKLQRRYNNRERELVNHRSRRTKEPVRDMKPAMLLDKISYWQRLLDRAIATQPTGPARNNRLVHVSLYAVVQETFDLYKDISDGLALLLDSFFHLQYQSCVHAFQTCVKASKQFEELSTFYTLCKSIGVGRTSEYPSVQSISNELVETLQEFLKDQSSFPATGRTPNKQLFLPAPVDLSPGRSAGGESYDQSEFSEPISDLISESNGFESQCKSLEDLISATELTGKRRSSISIDLEAYSFTDQLEKPSQQDDACSANDAASSKSLPTTASMVDLVSFDELPQPNVQDQGQEPLESALSAASTGWELVLAEATTSSTQPMPCVANGSEQKPLEFGTGWELVLAETTTQSTQPMPGVATSLGASLDSLYQQSAPLPSHHYNPFLQDTTELTVTSPLAAPGTTDTADFQAVSFPTSDPFSWTPTFQATPTFSAQNPNGTSMAMPSENDPFATCSPTMASEQMINGSPNQQNLLHEQQLWLQHQNKIIAKHIA